jgi:hypothetical protein
MGRISINAEVAQFAAGIDIDPSLWDAKAYRMTGRSRHAGETNHHIGQLTDKINRYYKQILGEQGYITAELVKNAIGVFHIEFMPGNIDTIKIESHFDGYEGASRYKDGGCVGG